WDPRLMGQADKRGAATVGAIRSELDSLFRDLDEIRRTTNPGQIAQQALASKSTGTPRMPAAMQGEIHLMAQRFQNTRQLGLEQSRIYRFHRELLEFLGTQVGEFRFLSTSDFTVNLRSYEGMVLRLHAELQQAMVSATTGSGQSADVQLTEWLNSHRTQIETLK